jgi:hypothetical protein
MHIGLHVSTCYSCPIVTKLESSSADFRQNTQMSNCIKIRPLGAEMFHADGQTDKTKLTVDFRNANASKNRIFEQKLQWKKCGDIQFYIHNILSDDSHRYFIHTVPRDGRHRHARRHSSIPWVWVHAFYCSVLQLILAWCPLYLKTPL